MSSQPSSLNEGWDFEPQPIRYLPHEELGPERYQSILIMDNLKRIHGYCFISIKFDIEIPGLVDRVHCPPVGWLGIYEDSLKASLRFSLHPFVIRLMIQYNICLAQIASNSWLVIIDFLSLCLLHKHNPMVDLFRACYSLKSHLDKDRWYFSSRKNLRFIRGVISSIHGWKVQFFFIRHDLP